MKLTHLLNRRIIIARMVTTTGNRIAYVTVTADMGHIQPMDLEKGQISDGVFGKTFRLYMEGETDIQEGDRLKDNNGNFYTVVSGGVSRRNFGSFDFKVVVLELTKNS